MQAAAKLRRWMRQLAEVRLDAARLRTHTAATAEALDIVRRLLELADTIRHEAGAAHRRVRALEQELEASERRAEAIFDMVPVAVVTTNTHGAILYANPVGCSLLGRGKTVLKRHPLLHHADDRERFAAIVAQLPAAAAPIVTTMRVRPCNRAPLDVTATIVRDVADGVRWHWFLLPLVPKVAPRP